MTQLTPEELAACQEARRFWNHETLDPDLPSHMFSAGLAHARAESAKEIADLNDSLSLAQTHVANLLIVESRLRDKIETLKAQVEAGHTVAEKFLGLLELDVYRRAVDEAIEQEKPNDR